MQCRTVYVLSAMLVVLGLGSDSPKEYDDATEVVGMEGTWEAAWGVPNERPDIQVFLTCRGGTYQIYSRPAAPWERGSYHIDATHKPPHLDLTASSGDHKGETAKLIYQIDGDKLRIGSKYDSGDTQRPQGFDNKGVHVGKWKRVWK